MNQNQSIANFDGLHWFGLSFWNTLGKPYNQIEYLKMCLFAVLPSVNTVYFQLEYVVYVIDTCTGLNHKHPIEWGWHTCAAAASFFGHCEMMG